MGHSRAGRARESDRSVSPQGASPIVHEAWPYHHGSEETAAYDAQIAFLVMNGGSTAQLSGVRRARIATAHRLADRGALGTKSN